MEPDTKTLSAQRTSTWASTLAKLLLVVVIIILANYGASALIEKLDLQIWPSHMEIVDRAVLIGVILYLVLMATPFMPGIEMGLALMIMLGPKGVLITYLCTLVALTVSFVVGRFFPTHLLVWFLRWLGLNRAAVLLENFNATPSDKRLEFLADQTSKKTIPALLKHRYLVLALLFNLPGNVVIGGGGGIAMMAGMSRLYSFSIYLPLTAIAVLPGPILIMLSKSLSS